MKILLLVFAAVILTVSGSAQKTADIGIWGGTSSYWGDVREVPPIDGFKLNLGAYFRYNFNYRVAMRAMFLTGKSSANGFTESAAWDFDKNIQDFSMQAEINFLRYMLGERKTPFTPYVTGGIGIMYFPYEVEMARLRTVNENHPLVTSQHAKDVQESIITPTIPFGFGIKFNLGERLGMGVEYQLRKIFSDKLDNLDDPLSYKNEDNEVIKYTTPYHNNDWPGFLGVHLTYKIYMGSKVCPAYDSKHW